MLTSPEKGCGDDIGEIGNHFGQGWVAVIAKEGLKQLTGNRILVQDHVHIPDVFDNGGDPADLVELVNAMRNKSGCEKDEQNAGHLEEFAQVEADSGGEYCVSEQRGGAQPEDRTRQGLDEVGGIFDLIACKECRGDEDGKLEAFTDHCHERQREYRPFARGCGSFVDSVFEFALKEAGLFAHPENHPGEDAGCDEHGYAFEDLFSLFFKRHAKTGEDNRCENTDEDCAQGSKPNGRGQVCAADLADCAEDNADDESGFEPFAQGK